VFSIDFDLVYLKNHDFCSIWFSITIKPSFHFSTCTGLSVNNTLYAVHSYNLQLHFVIETNEVTAFYFAR